MIDNNEINQNFQNINNNRLNPNYPSNLSLKRDSLMIHKGREFLKRKKAISLRHIFEDNKNIKININNNININTHLKRVNHTIDNQENSDGKGKTKMKSCIMGFEQDGNQNDNDKNNFKTVLNKKN